MKRRRRHVLAGGGRESGPDEDVRLLDVLLEGRRVLLVAQLFEQTAGLELERGVDRRTEDRRLFAGQVVDVVVARARAVPVRALSPRPI